MSGQKKAGSYAATIYVIAMFGVFPLVMHNRYYDLTKTRFLFFAAATAAVAACVLVMSFAAWLREGDFAGDVFAGAVRRLSCPDIFLLCFVLVAVCSCLCSEFMPYAVLGTEGRYIGMVPLVLCGAAYFIVSRLYDGGEFAFFVLCAVACAMFLLAVGHSFCFDPLGLQAGLDAENRAVFYSTIGNRNVLSSFVVMALGLASFLFCFEEGTGGAAVYAATCVLGFMALFACDSDSGFIGAAVMFYALPFFGRRKGFSAARYTALLALFFIAGKVMGILRLSLPTAKDETGFLMEILLYHPAVYAVIAALCVLEAALLYCGRNYYMSDRRIPKGFLRVWAVFGILAAALLIGAIVWFSAFDTDTDLGQLAGYLRLDEDWGSGRGEAWSTAFWKYTDYGPGELLIGRGPDTAALILNPGYLSGSGMGGSTYFDNCHNEYLQYLLTMGFLGLVSYVGFLVGVLAKMFKKGNRKAPSPAAAACGLSVLCYAAQALVNINQSITTPLVFVIAAVGVSYAEE